MKLNNKIIYFMILSYILLSLFDIVWKYTILIILFVYILINILHLKPLKNIDTIEEPSTFPLVSIIIPAWNEEGTIKRSILNILKSTYTNFELIVIAGGEDKTFELADDLSKKDKRIKAIKQEPLGKSAALNKGLKHKQGEIVIFLDADSLVDENWLNYLVKPIINKEANITVADFKPYIENWVTTWYSLYHSYLRYVTDKKGFFGGSTAFESAVFDNGIVLDDKVIADDYYLNIQCADKYKIKFVKDSVVRTDIPGTFAGFLTNGVRWVRILLHTTLLYNNKRKNVLFTLLNATYFTSGLPVSLLLYYIIGNKASFIFLEVWFIYFSLVILLNVIKPLALYRIDGNGKWLKYGWVALVFPIFVYLVYFYAMLTYKKVTPFFKGSRKF
ncbi:MAG: glycosyltransferase family 2 protein [Candidatus Methanoperedens sp.]|nr:glycosyltransferase family 2 protein [Candidatus Methanoperedens sp.]